jgi:general secretion pathway protein M
MKLAKREKYLVALAAGALVVFLLFQFVVFPFFDEKDRLDKGIQIKEDALKQMMMMSARYKAHQSGSESIQDLLSRREKGFTLFSFLDQGAGQAGVKEYIKYMKPSASEGTGPYTESMVEMKLEGITLKQLVEYLFRIESPKNLVTIKRISIKENKRESGYLDAVLQVLTVQVNQA